MNILLMFAVCLIPFVVVAAIIHFGCVLIEKLRFHHTPQDPDQKPFQMLDL